MAFDYVVEVKTESDYGSGTNENVFLRLVGARKTDGDWFLDKDGMDDLEAKENNPDFFLLRTEEFLGDINSIVIYVEVNKSDNDSPAWNLDYVNVYFKKGSPEEKKWNFPVYKWIGVQERDPSIKMVNYIEIDQKGAIIKQWAPTDLTNGGITKKKVENNGAPVPS